MQESVMATGTVVRGPVWIPWLTAEYGPLRVAAVHCASAPRNWAKAKATSATVKHTIDCCFFTKNLLTLSFRIFPNYRRLGVGASHDGGQSYGVCELQMKSGTTE